MSQMSVDELVKLLDSFSEKGGGSIKPQFEGEKTNFVVGSGETLSAGIKQSVDELTDYLVEEEGKKAEVFSADPTNDCVSCANIPNMDAIDLDAEF